MCDYISPQNYHCPRDAPSEYISESDQKRYKFCCFHLPISHPRKPSADDFITLIKRLIEEKDGDWFGFIFPKRTRLDNLNIDFKLLLSHAEFNNIYISNTKFTKVVQCEKVVFNDYVYLNADFIESANFSRSTFNGLTIIDGTFNSTSRFSGCIFKGRTIFRAKFKESVDFNTSVFHDAVEFRGTAKHFLKAKTNINFQVTANINKPNNIDNEGGIQIKTRQKNKNNAVAGSADSKTEINYVFHSEAHFQDVDFRRPERTKFINVNLSKAMLGGTDFRGVHFSGVNWWQDSLSRQGLYDEVWMNEQDKSFIERNIPQTEASYRNLRIALEENRDYVPAMDFYIGEMELRRRQKNLLKRNIFSIEAFYKTLSEYSGNPFRAIWIFILLVILHQSLTLFNLYYSDNLIVNFSFPQILSDLFFNGINKFFESLKILTVITRVSSNELIGWQSNLNVIFRIIGPVQITLIALAIRARIKRQ